MMLFKSYFFCAWVLLSCSWTGAWAQQLIATIPTRETPSEIQILPCGDSLLFAYEEAIRVSAQNDNLYYWIDGSGAVSQCNLTLPDEEFLAVMKSGDEFFFYYQDGNKASAIEVFVASADSASAVTRSARIELNGRIVGMYKERNLVVLTLHKNERILKVTEILGDSIVLQSEATVPVDLVELPIRQVTFIPPGSFLSIGQAKSKCKIYKDENLVTVVIDEPKEVTREGLSSLPARTAIYRANLLTGEDEIYMIGEPGSESFRSFLYKDHLYRMNSRFREIELKVFDIRGKPLSNVILNRKEEVGDFNYYIREGTANRISREVRSNIEGHYATPLSVIIEEDPDGNIYACLATYVDSNGAIGVYSADPITNLVGTVIGTAVLQLAEGPGISSHFYAFGHPEQGFVLAGNLVPNLIRAKIDEFEYSAERMGAKYAFKGYKDYGGGVIAVYRMRNTKSLEVVRFERTLPRKEYFTIEGLSLDGPKGAAYYRIKEKRGSRYFFKDTYVSSGQPYGEIECIRTGPQLVQHGKAVWYYETGGVKTDGYYANGSPSGRWTSYYEDGSPREETVYRHQEMVYSQCWTADGTPQLTQGSGLIEEIDEKSQIRMYRVFRDSLLVGAYWVRKSMADTVFQVVEKPANYHGGMERLYRHVNRNLKGKYPLSARREGVEGRVFIQFVVDKTGQMREPRVLKGIGAGCDQAALQSLVSLLPWEPAMHEGRPVKQMFVLPVEFRLR